MNYWLYIKSKLLKLFNCLCIYLFIYSLFIVLSLYLNIAMVQNNPKYLYNKAYNTIYIIK